MTINLAFKLNCTFGVFDDDGLFSLHCLRVKTPTLTKLEPSGGRYFKRQIINLESRSDLTSIFP
jgi:hypothetical protein